MKFINYLQSISGVSIFPMISLIVFFLFFVVLLFLVLRMNKKQITRLENIPLDVTETISSSEIQVI